MNGPRRGLSNRALAALLLALVATPGVLLGGLYVVRLRPRAGTAVLAAVEHQGQVTVATAGGTRTVQLSGQGIPAPPPLAPGESIREVDLLYHLRFEVEGGPVLRRWVVTGVREEIGDLDPFADFAALRSGARFPCRWWPGVGGPKEVGLVLLDDEGRPLPLNPALRNHL